MAASAATCTRLCDHGRLWVSSTQVLDGAPPAAPGWWLPSDRRAARLRRRFRALPPDEAVRIALQCAAGVDAVDDRVQRNDGDTSSRRVEHVHMGNDDPDEFQHRHRSGFVDLASKATSPHNRGDTHTGQEDKDKSADPDQTVRRRAAASCCRAVLLGPPPLSSHAELARRLEIVDELWRDAADEMQCPCDRLQPPRAGGQKATGVNPSVEADAAVLSASALVGSPLPPQAKAAARRLVCAVGDLWTVLPPSTLELINVDVARGVSSTHGDFVQAAAKAATTTTSTVSASLRVHAHASSKGGRRPETPHGCVIARDGVVLATGTNHTVPSIEAVEPHLREHIDALCGLIGDHRQWFRAHEARERSRASGNAFDRMSERVSFHAEQHAVLLAVSAGESLEGTEVYIAEVSEDGALGEAFPCAVCLPLLVHHRVSLVHFTTPDGLRTMDLSGLTARAKVSVTSGGSSACIDMSDSEALERCTHRGVVKHTALGKYGFIEDAAALDSVADAQRSHDCAEGNQSDIAVPRSLEDLVQQQEQQKHHQHQNQHEQHEQQQQQQQQQLGDVFFPLSAVHLNSEDRVHPSLQRFPDGSPFMHVPFREFLAGRPVAFCLGEVHESSEDNSSNSGRRRRRRPQATVVVPLDRPITAIPPPAAAVVHDNMTTLAGSVQEP